MIYNTRIVLALVLLAIAPAACTPVQTLVKDAWARPAPAGGNAAVYFQLQAGATPLQLVGAATSIAGMTMLHQTIHSGDGVVQMQPLPELSLAPGESVVFEPGGMHVMLLELNRPISVGDTFDLTLHTAEGKAVEITVDVVAR